MKKSILLVLLALLALSALAAQRNSMEFRFLASIKIENKDVLIGANFRYMQLFFDRWNNLYLPNADSHVVSIYSSDFVLKKVFITSKGEEILESSSSLHPYGYSTAYGSDSMAMLFYIKDGELSDLIYRINVGGDIAVDDFTVFYDYYLKKPRGWILKDRTTRTIKELNPEETIEYVRQNGARYGFSLKGDAILFHGWTWEDYGSRLVWNDERHAMWVAIDKDRIGYQGQYALSQDGRVVERFDFNTDPPGARYPNMDWTFDFEGNAYIFCQNDIFYLGRDWGYDKTFKGIVNDTNVSLRLHAGVQELKLGVLNKGEELKVLEKTVQKESISGLNASWYKVKRKDGLVGWMYGAYLKLPEGEERILVYDSPALSLRGLK